MAVNATDLSAFVGGVVGFCVGPAIAWKFSHSLWVTICAAPLGALFLFYLGAIIGVACTKCSIKNSSSK